jgi:hypothetical protein
VFGVEAVKPVRIASEQLSLLASRIEEIVEGVRGWRAVPREALARAILRSSRPVRARGRRRSLPTCHDAPCQVKVGRELSASLALAARVEGNLLGQCDLHLALYDLKRPGRDRRAHLRGSCADEALRLSVARALCQVLREDAVAEGSSLDSTDCLAAAELAFLEARLEAIRNARAKDLDEMVALERRLAEEALALRRAYERVVVLGRQRWPVSAVCRQGAVYDAFASALAASAESAEPSEAIRRQGAEALSRYTGEMRKALEGKLAPLRAQARQLYGRCLKLAGEQELRTRFIEEARLREAALR